MSQQIQITGGAKVRDLQDVIIGTSGVLSSLAFNVANGVPKLDSSGKILVSQLPNSVMEYLGTWDASTNTPTLANGTGNAGDVYLCNVAGTVNFGAGPISFVVSDQVIYSGSIWQKASGSNGTVTSVGVSRDGDALTITGSPITTSGTINLGFSGTSAQYINGAGNLTTFPSLTGYVPYTGATNDLNLGTHNLYANNLFDGFTNVAASGTQIVLTIASTPSYTITGSGGQTIKLPDATTLPNGAIFSFNNNQSSGAITINNNSNTLVVSVPSGGFAEVVLLDNSIAAGSWDRHFKAPSNVSWSTNTLDYAGSITSATWNGNVVAINRGGTGSSTQNFVDLTTTQTIGGAKTFTSALTASSLIKTGGTSSQFLKADGSVDSTSYGTGSVTSVAALTLGTTGTDLSSTVATGTTTPVITLNVPTASATNRGALSSTDWSTFNSKESALTFSSPLVRTTNTISIPVATTYVDGYLSHTDWNTFNNKASASGASGRVAFYNGTNSLTSDSYFYFDSTYKNLGLGDYSALTIPAKFSSISTVGAWYNRNTSSAVYNGIGLYYDATYGHLFQTDKASTASEALITFVNNVSTFTIDPNGYVGVNTIAPIPQVSGAGGKGLDIYGVATTAVLALHNDKSGTTSTDGARLYLTSPTTAGTGNVVLSNLESGNITIAPSGGNLYLQAAGFEKIRAEASGNVGILNPTTLTQALTVNGSVAATSYITNGATSSQFVKGDGSLDSSTYLTTTSAASIYVPKTRTITINGSSLDLTSDISFNVGTVTGSGTATRVAFWSTASNITSNAALYWDNTNLRLGIGGSPTVALDVTGAGKFSSSVTASSFVKTSGTSSQFLKADGSVDSTTYVSSVTGTSPVVSSGGATPAISMPVATSSVSGYLSSTDWSTFNSKGSGTVTSVATSSPLTGGTITGSGTIGITQSTTSANGYLSSTDWNTFNGKFTLPSLTSGSVLFSDGSTIAQDNTNFFWNNTAKTLKITSSATGTAEPYALHVKGLNNILTIENANTTGKSGMQFIVNSSPQLSIFYTTASGTSTISSASSDLRLFSGGGNGLTLANTTGAATFSSNVGVGTTSYTTSTGYTGVGINNATNGGVLDLLLNDVKKGELYITSSSFNMYAFAGVGINLTVDNSSKGLAITTAGNVGIGTSSPSFPLSIGSASGNSIAIQNNSSNYSRLYFTTYAAESASYTYLDADGRSTGYMAFRTNDTERMRITSAGNVGIGLSSPTAILHLSSTGRVFQWSGATTGVQYFDGANTGANLVWGMEGSAGAILYSGSLPYAAVFGNENNYPVQFGTNATIRMTITSGGNVLIGTTSDNGYKLQVAGVVCSTDASSAKLHLVNTGGGNNWDFNSYTNGQLYLQKAAGATNLGVFDGTTGTYTPLSDINKKKDFEQSALGLDAILGLKPTLYRMKDEDNTDKHLGFIAQEVKEFIPQAYVENGDDDNNFIGLDYQAITATLVKAVQELQEQINELKNK